MKAVPYFYYNGNAEEALNFYSTILGGEVSDIMRFKDQAGPEMTPEFGERVMHAELKLGEDSFYFSDTMGEDDYKVGNNVQININCDNEEQIRRIFEQFSDHAKITMALEDTFWGALYGALEDKFGVSWSFNYQK